MVTKEAMQDKEYTCYKPEVNARVEYPEMIKRVVAADLPDMLEKVLSDYCKEHRIQDRYRTVGDLCQMNEKTLRGVISGKNDVTRAFLYKFTVGLKMDLDKANELFAKCGGELYEKNAAEYLVMHTLMDKDDIYFFLDEYENYNCQPPLRKLKVL